MGLEGPLIMRTWLCTVALAAMSSAGDANLLRNGGFDKGTRDWFWVSNSRRAKIQVEKGAIHIEKQGGFPVDVLGQAFDVPRKMRGGRFTISAKVKAEASGNAWLKLYLYNANGDVVIDDVAVAGLRGSFQWKTVEKEFKIPADAVSGKVLLQVFLGGEIWIDDVTVTWGEEKKKARKKTKPLDKRTKDWLDKNAVPVKTIQSNPRDDFKDLAPLKEALKDVRIVQLGENTHGDGACFLAKCRLIKWLHEELDFNVVAFESGLFECDRANALIKPDGDPKDVMRAAIFRIWHTRRTKPLFAYLNATAGTRKPMALAGFDPQQSGEFAKDFVGRLTTFFLDAGIDKPATFNFLARADQAMQQRDYRPKPVTAQALKKVAALFLSERAKLEKKHGARETAFWERAFANYRVNEQLRRTKDGKASFNLRDEWMGKNLIWLAEHRFKGKKIVVWAATRHIAHELKSIREKGAGQYRDTKCMGEYVHEHFGKACYTVGFAAYGGRGGRWFQGKWDVPPPKPNSFEDICYRYGKPLLFVDFSRRNPFDKPMLLGVLAYTRDFKARWPRVIDGVFYIEEMVPAAFMGD